MKSPESSHKRARILLLEDNMADAKLCFAGLARAGFECDGEVVSTGKDFTARVQAQQYDLILADFRLPDWTGLEAVQWLRSSGFTLPFILVTGTLGDELAIECIQAGVSDYVLKDHLERLPIVVERALEAHRAREERDRAESELRASEEQYRLLFEANPNPMWVYSTETLRFLAVNATAVADYGYSRGEFLSMTVKDIRLPADVPRFLEEHKKTLDSLEPSRQVWEHVKKDGSRIEVAISSAPILFRNHKARLVLAEDITDSLRAEAALRETTQSYQSIVEGAPFGILQTEVRRVSMANPALAAILGYESEAELQPLNLAMNIYCDSNDCLQDLQKYDSGMGRVVDLEAKWRRKDGNPITVRCRGRTIPTKAGQPLRYEIFVENITEQRSLEQQFRQAQKMEAIGRLAGGVAHDFNNLLMIMTSYAQLIEDCATDSGKVTRYATQIRDAARKAASVTKQLLAFSRKQIQELRVLNLDGVVSEFGKMLPQLLGEDVEMAIKTAPAECLVYADRGQIEQVIMNLVVNARDAMPSGGKLTIETGIVQLDEQYSRRHAVQVSSGSYAMLAVTDNGIGMDAETQARIFEPFYTTKEPGKGTGLGLATVYGIVKQSNGVVWVYSELGKGTTFKVYLPLAQTAVEAESPSSAEQGPITGGSETILMVEDEPLLREANREFLEVKGYRVLEASNGAEALQICQTHQGPIDLLLTDVIMPGISGIELAKSVLASRPAIRVVYMSGYTDQTVDKRALAPSAMFLQKPCSLALLAQAIRTAIGPPRKGSN
jgi:two-component system, cell cycle sensor histidine kinase and response regulator CckA